MEGRFGVGRQLFEKVGASFHRPGSSMTPLERFLCSSSGGKGVDHPSIKRATNDCHGRKVVTVGDGSKFSYWDFFAAIDIHPSKHLLDEASFCDEFLVDGDVGSGEIDVVLVDGNGNNGNANGADKSQRGKGVRYISYSSSNTNHSVTNVVKGHWTAEEDSLLRNLVNQHGVKKWSQTAKKLVGRTGKQCTERWHNHLRPDIKKETWSEEEELLFVEAHKKVGNKWVEIAKHIPGRAENSIKNHWNATKRRQSSKRKSKKKVAQGERPSPSILQEYIKAKIAEEQHSTTTTTTPSRQLQFVVQRAPETMSMSVYDFSNLTTTIGEDAMLYNYEGFQGLKVDTQMMQEPWMVDSLHVPTFDDDHDHQKFIWMNDHSTIKAPDNVNADPKSNLVPPNASSKYGLSNNTDGAITGGSLLSDIYISSLLQGTHWPSVDTFEKISYPKVPKVESFSSAKKDMDLIEMITDKFSQP